MRFSRRRGPSGRSRGRSTSAARCCKDRTSFALSHRRRHRSTTRRTSSPRRWTGRAARRSGGRPIASTSTAGSITTLTKSHTLRAMFQQNGSDQRNLGVGAFDLPGRAFGRTATRQHAAAGGERAVGPHLVRRDRGCRSAGRKPVVVGHRSRRPCRCWTPSRRAARSRPAAAAAPSSNGRPTSTSRGAGTR